MWAAIVSADVTIPQFAVLRALHDEAWIDQTTLSDRAALDRSNTADVVHRLAKRDLIYRHRDIDDGRRRLLGLTPKGEALYLSLLPATQLLNQRLLAALDPLSRVELSRLLALVVEGSEQDLAQLLRSHQEAEGEDGDEPRE